MKRSAFAISLVAIGGLSIWLMTPPPRAMFEREQEASLFPRLQHQYIHHFIGRDETGAAVYLDDELKLIAVLFSDDQDGAPGVFLYGFEHETHILDSNTGMKMASFPLTKNALILYSKKLGLVTLTITNEKFDAYINEHLERTVDRRIAEILSKTIPASMQTSFRIFMQGISQGKAKDDLEVSIEAACSP